MDSKRFVEGIKKEVRDSAIEVTKDKLVKVPGRKPRDIIVKQSDWYNNLDIEGRGMVDSIIKEVADEAVFGFLTVLDGVRDIDEYQTGEFRVFYEVDGESKVIDADFLHDVCNEGDK